MKTLTAEEKPVAKIFSDEYVFNIPGYQRPYAWTTEQAGELLEDFLSYMRGIEGGIEAVPPYFLGSIVLIKDSLMAQADVVDGQQRLTTLTILLAAIRSRLSSNQASGVTKLLCEKGNEIVGTKDRFRIALRERDKKFFETYVQAEGGFEQLLQLRDELPDSQDSIRANARLFNDSLTRLSETELLRLAQFTATRCYLVVVATPDLDSAYRIFSVLNSRGLDLAATDILKAEILGGIPKSVREDFTAKWENVEEDLGREAFQDLFSHIRMVYRKVKPQSTLIREFKDHVMPLAKPQTFLDGVLLPMAKAYKELVDSAYSSTSNSETVNQHLAWLNRIEFSDWLPPALAFMTKHRQESVTVLAFVRDLERLVYWMLVTRMGINQRIERFSQLTQAIEAGGSVDAADSPLQLSPAEQLSMYNRLNGPLYDSLAARARSAVLLRVDALVSGGGATYDYNVVTVEHVLPQNPDPGSKWLQWFPTQNERELWVHRLGNLALLTRKKNSSANNYEFEVKKKSYFSTGGVSPFALTTQVLARAEWTPIVVSQRQDELMAVLERHWRLENRQTAETSSDAQSTQHTSIDAAPSTTKTKRFVVAVAGDEGEIELWPMKEWLRQNPQYLPTGLDARTSHSHKLRDALKKSGWNVQDLGGEIRLTQPAGAQKAGGRERTS